MIRHAPKFGNSFLSLSNCFFPRLTFRFSSEPIMVSYPYVFGGLKDIDFTPDEEAAAELQNVFGSQNIEGFKEAYKYMLQSLAQKDLNALQKVSSSHLTKNICLQNVQLINRNADIEAICIKKFIVFGVQFQRQNPKLLEVTIDDKAVYYLNLAMFKPNNFVSSIKEILAKNQQALLCYEILFKSKMKLIKNGSMKSLNQQIHSIQFEMQGNGKILDYFKQANKMKFSSNRSQSKWKQIVGTNFEWKIYDFDRVLKENLDTVY